MGWYSLISWLTIVATFTVLQLSITSYNAKIFTRVQQQEDYAFSVLLCSVNFFINLIKCSFIMFLGAAASEMFYNIPENRRTGLQYRVTSKTMICTVYVAKAAWYGLAGTHVASIILFGQHRKRGPTSDVALVFLIGDKISASFSLLFDAVIGKKVFFYLSAYLQYLEIRRNR